MRKKLSFFLLTSISLLIVPGMLRAQAPIISVSFEQATFPPPGWTIGNYNGNTWKLNTDALYVLSGTRSACYAASFSDNANAWMYSPLLYLTAGSSYRISYWYRSGSTTVEKFRVNIGLYNYPTYPSTLLHDYPSVSNPAYRSEERRVGKECRL